MQSQTKQILPVKSLDNDQNNNSLSTGPAKVEDMLFEEVNINQDYSWVMMQKIQDFILVISTRSAAKAKILVFQPGAIRTWSSTWASRFQFVKGNKTTYIGTV